MSFFFYDEGAVTIGFKVDGPIKLNSKMMRMFNPSRRGNKHQTRPNLNNSLTKLKTNKNTGPYVFYKNFLAELFA